MATIGRTRLLIATGEAAASEEELPRLVRALIESASEVDRTGRPPTQT